MSKNSNDLAQLAKNWELQLIAVGVDPELAQRAAPLFMKFPFRTEEEWEIVTQTYIEFEKCCEARRTKSGFV